MITTNKKKLIAWVIAFVLGMIVAILSGCDDRTTKEKEDHRRTRTENAYKELVAYNIHYVYDPRTDLCFAITQQQRGHAAWRTMTVVPYERVKDRALVIEYIGKSAEEWEEVNKKKRIEWAKPPE